MRSSRRGLLFGGAGQASSRAGEAGPRPRDFWTAIVDSGFAVPAGERPLDLLVELGRHFGHPDAVLRDRCGYGITARWVVREKRLSPADLQTLADTWAAGLLAESDPYGGDPTLRRSFSALGLSLVAAAALDAQALDGPTRLALVSRAAEQLRTNTDRRGFDPVVGWVHVTAHTADLLKFLGRDPRLTRAQQGVVLGAIADTLVAAPAVFTWGEDERLARAAASVLRRDDVDGELVRTFLETLSAAGRRVDWDRPLAGAGLAPLFNAKTVLKDLYLVLDVAGREDLRRQVLACLEQLA